MTSVAIGVSSIVQLPDYAIALQNGLTSAAIGLIALAALRLSEKLLGRRTEKILALVSAGLAVCYSFFWMYPVIMVAGGCFVILEEFVNKRFWLGGVSGVEYTSVTTEEVHLEIQEDAEEDEPTSADQILSIRSGLILFGVFVTGLVSAIIMRSLPSRAAQVFGTFYTVGMHWNTSHLTFQAV
jgi:hypothetical protein